MNISSEGFIANLKADVYPITIIKFLLNKKKILTYFNNLTTKDVTRESIKINIENCESCKSKKESGFLCRAHTSIQRVLNCDNVAFDLDTNVYFYKNEIFRMIGDKLAIIYCPHPKLLTETLTDEKIRKFNTIVVNEKIDFPEIKNRHEFLSTFLLNHHLQCWFNDEFSIITQPNGRNYSNYSLVPNRKQVN
jgi:hypothetical protein